MNWYVVYTKPKWEKKVAERLNEIGVVTYCPLVTKTSQWSDRKKKISVPLFNSYIFVKVEDKERNRVFEITGAIRYLFWLGKPAIVKDSEIETIQQWLSAPDIYEVSLAQWKKGDKKLYSASYNFYITLTQEKTPSADELSKLLGISVYKKGGKLSRYANGGTTKGFEYTIGGL